MYRSRETRKGNIVRGIPYYATAAAVGLRDHCAQFDQICCIASSDSAVTYLIKYRMFVRVLCGVVLHIGQTPHRITAIALTAIRTVYTMRIVCTCTNSVRRYKI